MAEKKRSSSRKKIQQKPTAAKKVKEIRAPKELPVWVPVLVFALTTAIFFWGQLTGQSFFWEDFVEYVWPVQSYSASEFANGNIPFWNPYTFAGMPFLADLQVGFFYPFNRLLSLFVSDGSLPVGALQFMIILHFFIAQLNIYFLARSWKTSSYGSMISAVSFGFSLMLVFHVIHPMIVYHLAWFPLVVMLFRLALIRRSLFHASLSGLILGMSMLSGHPQMTLYEVFFLVLMFVWYLVSEAKAKTELKKRLPMMIVTGFLSLIIAAGIFCIQYLPSQQLADLSQRAEMTYEGASEGSLRFSQLYTAVAPKLYGFVDGTEDKSAPYHLMIDTDAGPRPAPYYYYWESAFYAGLVALLLGIFGAAMNFRTRRTAFLIFAALFGILFAMGSNAFIFPIFYNLPFFGSFRNPARMMFYFSFAMSILAGFGFDSLRKQENGKTTKILIVFGIFVFISLLIASGGLLSAIDTPEQYKSQIGNFGVFSLVISILIFLIAFFTSKGKIKPEIAGLVLLVIAFVDLHTQGASFNSSKKDPADYYSLQPELKERLTPDAPENIFRVNMRLYQPRYMAMQRNQGMVDRIMLVEGYNPLILERVNPPVSSRDELNAIFNVRYEIGIDTLNRRYQFLERDYFFPRAWLVYRAVKSEPENVDKIIREKNYDLRKIAVIEEDPGIEISDHSGTFSQGGVECLEYEANYMRFEAKTEKPGILCFSEIWYPAWKAYVDGKEAKMLRTNYSLRSVPVPAGTHIVEMKYESGPFAMGKYITIFTLILSIVLIIIGARTK